VQVQLLSAGPRKIGVIKVVREFTNWGLKEAKGWVDGAPSSALEIAPEQADAFALALRNEGATVQVSGGATVQAAGGATVEAAGGATAPAAGATTGGSDDSLAVELEQLAALHDKGVLSDEEFTAAKSRLLGMS
jgi:hypothetical protein